MKLGYTITEVAGMIGISCPATAREIRVTGVSTDTRSLHPGDLFFALSGDTYDGDSFVDGAFKQGAVAAVTHTAHGTGPCLLHASPREALRHFAAAHRTNCPARIIAITGSCGKTTTKDMIAAVLGTKYRVSKTRGNLNNDVGCPLSLLDITPETHYAIIEMGANHPGEIARLCSMARPDESAVTMVAPAHLEGFGDIRAVARAKAEIVEALPADGCFYVNGDDPYCVEMASMFSGDKIYFGKRGDVALNALDFDETGEMVLSIAPIGTIRLPLHVRAHSTNVLLTVAVGMHHHVSEFEAPLRAACADALRFKVVQRSPWIILDDTYNANPASMAAAIEALADYPGKRKIAVLGTMFELGNASARLHEIVGETVAANRIDWLLAMGENAADMVAGARAAGIGEAAVFETHEAVAGALRASASAGDVVLVKGSRGMKMESVIALLKNAPVLRE